jgi:hypothetical protein
MAISVMGVTPPTGAARLGPPSVPTASQQHDECGLQRASGLQRAGVKQRASDSHAYFSIQRGAYAHTYTHTHTHTYTQSHTHTYIHTRASIFVFCFGL